MTPEPKITVKRAAELSSAELCAWRSVQQQNQAFSGPFLSPGLAVSLIPYVKELKVALVEGNNRQIAFLPYTEIIDGVGIPVGWPANDCQALVGSEIDTISTEHLLEAAGLEILYFDHLLSEQPPFHSFHSSYAHRAHCCHLSAGVSVEQLFDRSKNFRSNLRRARKDFIEVFGHEPEITLSSGTPDLLEQVLSWKERHYLSTESMLKLFEHRSASLFEILPWLKPFFLKVYSEGNADFGLLVALLAGKGSIIAGEVLFRSGGTAHSYMAGYDAQYKRLSPGMIVSTELLRNATKFGIATYDLGYGDEGYKKYLSSSYISLVTAVVTRENLRAHPKLVTDKLVTALSAAVGCGLTPFFRENIERMVISSLANSDQEATGR